MVSDPVLGVFFETYFLIGSVNVPKWRILYSNLDHRKFRNGAHPIVCEGVRPKLLFRAQGENSPCRDPSRDVALPMAQ